MSATQYGKPRVGWLAAALVLLALAALGVPNRMLTQWGYAVERGRLRASTEELAAVGQDLARVEEVSRAFRLVAKVARPGVVHIRVRGGEEAYTRIKELEREREELIERWEALEQKIGKEADDLETYRSEIRDLLRHLRQNAEEIATLQQTLPPGSASGIIFDEGGHILTNNHVVGGRRDIRVTLPDEREYEATLVGSDPKTDLAVIKIDASDLHPLKFGDSDRVEVGDWVIAVGAPFGLSQTVTHGIISATGRSDVLTGRGILYQNFLQTDAAINPGNSGGPLLNLKGEVVGVNTAIATNGDAYNAGIAFTIPANMAVRIADQLKQTGQVARGWLGITMGELTTADREVFGVEGRQGVLVDAVIEHAPADQAALLVEDVILTVNGTAVANMADLRGRIADILPGHDATLGLLRDGARTEITVKLGRRPTDVELDSSARDSRRARELPQLGLYARTLLPSFAPRAGYKEDDRGARVIDVTGDESNAAPIEPGELIVACNGEPVTTVAALSRVLEATSKNRTVKLEVVDPEGQRRTVRYRPGQ